MTPHDLLEVPRGASKAEVLKAVAKALRERKHSAKDIALAQKALLDPVKAAAEHFNDLDFATLLRQLDAAPPDEFDPDALAHPLDASTL